MRPETQKNELCMMQQFCRTKLIPRMAYILRDWSLPTEYFSSFSLIDASYGWADTKAGVCFQMVGRWALLQQQNSVASMTDKDSYNTSVALIPKQVFCPQEAFRDYEYQCALTLGSPLTHSSRWTELPDTGHVEYGSCHVRHTADLH